MRGGRGLGAIAEFAVQRKRRIDLAGLAQCVGLQQAQCRGIAVALAEGIHVRQRGVPGALLLHALDQLQIGVAAVLRGRRRLGQARRTQVLRRGGAAAGSGGNQGKQQAGGAQDRHEGHPIFDKVVASATSAGPASTSISAGSRVSIITTVIFTESLPTFSFSALRRCSRRRMLN
ncbi:hypothetical protein D3C72_1509460 [compost metagenome]